MTDQPGVDPEQRLPATRPPADVAPTDRFSAPPSIHVNELSPERAAGIVRQSASARFVGLIAVLVVVLFVIIYYFYELGVPGIPNTSRLAAETNAQQVTAVENGYQIYEANCARCHGAQGQGGIGPVLDDQSKLFVHLNESYIRAVLFAGGRYVCGNPKSDMPVWDSNNGGPLNYEQINDLIAFIRAPSTGTYTVRDPSTKEPVTDPVTGKVETFTGWVDPNYKPAPNATPFPDCWSDAFGTPATSPAASGTGATPSGPIVKEEAQGTAFLQTSLSTAANQAFTIEFNNQDSGVPHNIEIKDASGASKFKGRSSLASRLLTTACPRFLPGRTPSSVTCTRP